VENSLWRKLCACSTTDYVTISISLLAPSTNVFFVAWYQQSSTIYNTQALITDFGAVHVPHLHQKQYRVDSKKSLLYIRNSNTWSCTVRTDRHTEVVGIFENSLTWHKNHCRHYHMSYSVDSCLVHCAISYNNDVADAVLICKLLQTFRATLALPSSWLSKNIFIIKNPASAHSTV